MTLAISGVGRDFEARTAEPYIRIVPHRVEGGLPCLSSGRLPISSTTEV